MDICIIGLGSIGQRHLKNIHAVAAKRGIQVATDVVEPRELDYLDEATRSLVAEKATAVAGEAKDAAGKGVGMLKEVPAKAQGVVGSVTGGSDGASVASQSDDELREKIEAARRRIAAQVMENAEQSQAVEVEAAPEAEEAPAAE